MSSVIIEHNLGDVRVERGGKAQKVAVTFGSESEPFRLRDGDTIVTGKDGYVVDVAEQKPGKYRSLISIAPQSNVSLDISTTISKMKIENGVVRVVTNAPIEIPLVDVNYVSADEYPHASASGDNSIFSLISVGDEAVTFANMGFPVDIVHKESGETVRLMQNEQATATAEKLSSGSDVDKEIKEVFRKVMEINQNKIDDMTREVQLGFYRSLGEAQEGIAKGIEEGLSYISLEGLESLITGWKKGLQEDLEDMSPALKKDAKPLVEEALEQWEELTKGLVERKKEKRKEKKTREDTKKLIKEVRANLPPLLAAQHEGRLRQYMGLKTEEKKRKKEKKKKKESTEMEKKLDKMNKEIEEGLEKLSKEIDDGESSEDDSSDSDSSLSDLEEKIANL